MSDWRDRFSTLWLAATAVAIVGIVLAIIGLIAGGPDESRRETLRNEVDRAQRQLTTAESELDSLVSQGLAYSRGAQAIVREGDQFCGCGQRGRQFQKELEVRLRSVVANPTPATVSAYSQAADRANAEKERFENSLLRLRSLRSSLPEPPAG